MTRIQFIERSPPPALASWVQSLWAMRSTERPGQPLRVVPDGCIDLVVHLASVPSYGSIDRDGSSASVSLVGPRRTHLTLHASGPIHAVGLCVRPGGLAPLLRCDAGDLANAVVALDEVRADLARELVDRLSTSTAADELDMLADVLDRRARPATVDPVIDAALALIRQSRGAASVTAIADAVGRSSRQLERRFATDIGLSPKAYSRIVRFDAVTRRLRAGRQGWSWCAIADAHGYFDQAHLIREFQAIGGQSPADYERELASS